MYELPTIVTVGDNEYKIRNKGDFRTILDCISALNDYELDGRYRIITALIIFYDGVNSQNDLFTMFDSNLELAVQSLFDFINCGQETVGMDAHNNVIDWEKDEFILMSAINGIAKRELRLEPYVHWWTFIGYYCDVGESILSTVVGIRTKLIKGKKLEKYEQEFKRNNPQYFNFKRKSEQEIKDDEYIKEIWGKEE